MVKQFMKAHNQCFWIQFLILKYGTVPISALVTWLSVSPDSIERMGFRLVAKIRSKPWSSK
jgi:hypothetical protein